MVVVLKEQQVKSENTAERPAEHRAHVYVTCLTELEIQRVDHDPVDAYTSVSGPSLA